MIRSLVWRLLAGMSIAGTAWAGVLIVGLVAGTRLLPLVVVAPVTAVLVIPGVVVVVLANTVGARPRVSRASLWPLLSYLPRWALPVCGGLFFAFWLAAMPALISMQGNPEFQNGQYVLDSHGVLTVVDKTTYERALVNEERIALGVLGGFGVAGSTLCVGSVARARAERSRPLGH